MDYDWQVPDITRYHWFALISAQSALVGGWVGELWRIRATVTFKIQDISLNWKQTWLLFLLSCLWVNLRKLLKKFIISLSCTSWNLICKDFLSAPNDVNVSGVVGEAKYDESTIFAHTWQIVFWWRIIVICNEDALNVIIMQFIIRMWFTRDEINVDYISALLSIWRRQVILLLHHGSKWRDWVGT